MLTGNDQTEVAEGGAGADEAAGPNDADPIYIQLDPAFVVNFQDKNNHTKFLKAELNVVTFDESVGEAITQHMPAIRNNLILLFSRQLYEDLIPHEGKEVLRAQALAQVQTVIEKQLGKGNVDDLFFTSFVMQ
jgi:flagellar FliL protein